MRRRTASSGYEISWEEYHRELGPLHDRIFSGRALEDRPFCEGDWQMALLVGGIKLAPSELRALGNATGRGRELVLLDAYGAFPEEPPRVVPWSADGVAAAIAESPLPHIAVHVFDRSGDWGIVTSPEGFGLLGATPGVMEAFVEASGGREELLRRFLAVAPGLDPEDWGYEYVERLLLIVGWVSK